MLVEGLRVDALAALDSSRRALFRFLWTTGMLVGPIARATKALKRSGIEKPPSGPDGADALDAGSAAEAACQAVRDALALLKPELDDGPIGASTKGASSGAGSAD